MTPRAAITKITPNLPQSTHLPAPILRLQFIGDCSSIIALFPSIPH